MAVSSPAVAQWELAVRLRSRRKGLGLGVNTVSSKLGFTRNYWSLVENDRGILSSAKLVAVGDVLQFDEAEMRELLELRQAAKERGWWAQYSNLFDAEQLRIYGLESGAESVRNYEGILISGLLQTEEYARAVIKAHPANAPMIVEERVEIRMRRQERLFGHDALRLTAVMSQAALLQQIGGVNVLRRQLIHLATVIEDLPETSEVRVLPFTSDPRGMTGGSTLYLLDFGSPHLSTVAWQDSSRTIGIGDNPSDLQELVISFAQALESTLSREDSLDLIQRTAKELG